MQYRADSPEDYISQIPEERQEVMKKLRKVIQDNLPKGFEEGMNYNMIGYYVPHSIYPDGYHCDTKLPLPFMNIASQKNFVAVYHMGMYAKKELLNWFTTEYPKHCKYKLDMGKSCVRFKKIEDIPFALIGQLTAKMSAEEWIQVYENAFKK
ncbi:MAG: hypothetical protein DA407_11210 [Bacteroidetes bacterium]|nr:MAG: hypothetical protein DA407_11210 [Bacteroidota bacterium]